MTASQRHVQLGMSGATGRTVMLSAMRAAANGLELVPLPVNAMARPKKANLARMEPVPSGASGVTSVNAALNAAMALSRAKESASESAPVTVTQVNVKSVAMVTVLAGQIGRNGQFVVSLVAKDNITELENVAV